MDFFNSTNLPVPDDQLARNVEAALTTIGSGGGGWGPPGVQYMRIDTQTGAVTHSRDGTPVPLQDSYASPLALVRHGFKVENGRVVDQVMEPIVSHPTLPVPKQPYVDYPHNGPRKAIEAIFLNLDERGFNLLFGALNVSNSNGLARLIGDGLM